MTFDVIVVDPPWQIEKLARSVRPKQVAMDYSLMSIAEISKLPIGEIASPNAWCFLWIIQKYLFEGRAILEDWGFHHLLTMVWKKTYGRSAGMPLYGFMWNGEFILAGYKGRPELWPKRPLIPVVFDAENKGHSVKPESFYDMVEVLGPKRIDIFARRQRFGWVCVGKGVTGNDVLFDLRQLGAAMQEVTT